MKMYLVSVAGNTTVDRDNIGEIAVEVLEMIKSKLPEEARTFGVIDYTLGVAKEKLQGMKAVL